MDDLEISKRLAHAIGYLPEHVRTDPVLKKIDVFREAESFGGVVMRMWRIFDYHDWSVIGPIAERYFAFPAQFVDSDGKVIAWEANLYSEKTGGFHSLVKADTPQKAIALAVIQGATP